MKVIIFGGAGFIGKHLQQIMSNNIIYDIAIDDTLDVREPIKINSNNDNVIAIVNLAAVHKTPGHPDCDYYQTNMLGAENICKYAEENGINTILFTSSIAPYGASESQKTEKTLPMPNTPYGISKLVAEEIHKRWQAGDPENRRLIILRPGIVFGKGEEGNFTRLFNMLKKRRFFFPGRKDTLKSSIYVKDLTRLMVEMIENEPAGVHLYNMVFPEQHTIEYIVKNICDVISISSKVPLLPAWLLKMVATLAVLLSKLLGFNMEGIHPDRVIKLMVSTNISGIKLHDSGYTLQYSFKEAIQDWYDNDIDI
jgi:GlcNAc-P-P-Und epimerase